MCSDESSVEVQQRLPVAWRAALASCPYCSGSGSPDGTRVCMACDSTGDLFGAMLLDAWRQGRDAVLWELGGVARTASAALASATEKIIPTAELKRSVGL